MKKGLIIVVLFLVVFSFLVSCGETVKTWRVTKSTGLYYRADMDSNKIITLSVGTKVRDSEGKDYLSRCAFPEGVKVCRVALVDTGTEGYVIAKWLDD